MQHLAQKVWRMYRVTDKQNGYLIPFYMSLFAWPYRCGVKEGETEHVVKIQVLYDGQREIREAFTVHMKPDEYMVAETQVRDHHL